MSKSKLLRSVKGRLQKSDITEYNGDIFNDCKRMARQNGITLEFAIQVVTNEPIMKDYYGKKQASLHVR